ncbi:glutamate racemase [Candidatus Saccharibacteria bacterium]|nr:glutamate racemase [Candidatus Saccharibacteria bacterium]
MRKVKIGVFDSGVGGLSVVRAIKAALPEAEIILRSDKEHFPYGSRSTEDIYEFTKPILQDLVTEGCSVIVIACNTVTTNFISQLRKELPVPLVGIEPMVKPAAEASRSGVIAVCATLRTLESKRYFWLKDQYAKGVKVLEPDCSQWASMVESNRVDREKVANIINDVLDQKADQIVLGCTHFHWIQELIQDIAKDRAQIIQPEQAVVVQLIKVISKQT